MTTTFYQALRHREVTKVNGHKVTRSSVNFLKNELQVTTVRDTHYFDNVDKLIAFNDKAIATDLSGQRCLLEIGVSDKNYPFAFAGRVHATSLVIVKSNI